RGTAARDAEQRPRGDRLAGAGLADECHAFARRDRERHPAHHARRPTVEAHAEVLRDEDRLGAHRAVPETKRRCSQRPTTLIAMTVTARNTPGHTPSHGAKAR